MATYAFNTNYTLAHIAKRMDPDGSAAVIAEVLDQTNDVLKDAVWVEANDLLTHQYSKRKSLPTGTWGKFNQGTPIEASQITQEKENIGFLETVMQADSREADMFPGGYKAFLQMEARAFLEGLGQTIAYNMIYGDSTGDPAKVKGFANRLNTLSLGNVVGQSGTGSDVTSVWVVQWGVDKVFCCYPRGSKAGIERDFRGKVEVSDASGNPYTAYREYFRQHLGICIKDDRCIQRIANIETSGTSNILDEDNLIKVLNRMPMGGSGAVIYCNKTIKTQLDILAKDKTNVQYSPSSPFGDNITTFRGIPVRVVEQIVDTETAIS